jgi:hypothetical protein
LCGPGRKGDDCLVGIGAHLPFYNYMVGKSEPGTISFIRRHYILERRRSLLYKPEKVVLFRINVI